MKSMFAIGKRKYIVYNSFLSSFGVQCRYGTDYSVMEAAYYYFYC
jgi:hypothetical protein